MAGFQVIIYGRFWVITEGGHPPPLYRGPTAIAESLFERRDKPPQEHHRLGDGAIPPALRKMVLGKGPRSIRVRLTVARL